MACSLLEEWINSMGDYSSVIDNDANWCCSNIVATLTNEWGTYTTTLYAGTCDGNNDLQEIALYAQETDSIAVPSDICDFTELQSIGIYSSASVTSLPSLEDCMNLDTLTISSSSFMGSLPSLPSSLISLNLADNQFTGPFSVILNDLPNLEDLNINMNYFTGVLPTSLPVHLTAFEASTNAFSGSIPDWSGYDSLETVALGSNALTGTLPTVYPQSLTSFSVSRNALTGLLSICESCTTIFHVASNQLTGTLTGIPSDDFDVSNNLLSGPVDTTSLVTASNIMTLALANNQFTGPIPSCPDSVSNFVVDGNMFTGTFNDVGLGMNHFSLTAVSVANNFLTGPLPSINALNLFSLYYLDLSGNQFTGTLAALEVVEAGINSVQVPRTLDVSDNLLTGSLADLGNGSDIDFPVYTFKAAGNGLTGNLEILTTFGLPYLWNLDLSRNAMGGNLDSLVSLLSHKVSEYSQIRAINLADNQLTGTVDLSSVNASFLMILDLSDNLLTGSFSTPQLPMQCNLLENIFLANNLFDTVDLSGLNAELPTVRTIDLSYNLISEISVNLTEVTNFDISNNQLDGLLYARDVDIHEFGIMDLSNNLYQCPYPDQVEFTSVVVTTFCDPDWDTLWICIIVLSVVLLVELVEACIGVTAECREQVEKYIKEKKAKSKEFLVKEKKPEETDEKKIKAKKVQDYRVKFIKFILFTWSSAVLDIYSDVTFNQQMLQYIDDTAANTPNCEALNSDDYFHSVFNRFYIGETCPDGNCQEDVYNGIGGVWTDHTIKAYVRSLQETSFISYMFKRGYYSADIAVVEPALDLLEETCVSLDGCEFTRNPQYTCGSIEGYEGPNAWFAVHVKTMLWTVFVVFVVRLVCLIICIGYALQKKPQPAFLAPVVASSTLGPVLYFILPEDEYLVNYVDGKDTLGTIFEWILQKVFENVPELIISFTYFNSVAGTGVYIYIYIYIRSFFNCIYIYIIYDVLYLYIYTGIDTWGYISIFSSLRELIYGFLNIFITLWHKSHASTSKVAPEELELPEKNEKEV